MHTFKKSSLKKSFIFSLLIILSLSGFGCKLQGEDFKKATQSQKLTYWRVWDTPKDFDEIINAYKIQHPNISIQIVNFRYEEYEQKLLEAMAEDRGPDIFSVHSSWIPKYENRIAPIPAEIRTAYQTTQKSLGFKNEVVVDYRTTKSITPEQVRASFLGPVAEEVIRNNKIYAIPLFLDTLATYYNIDLLNNAGIPLPASKWAELQEQTPLLTLQDKEGNIVQSAVALGTRKNVERYFDILSLLMMQNGTEMLGGGKSKVTFDVMPPNLSGRATPPGEDAIRFYTEFSQPSKNVYTWNASLENSFDAFVHGKTTYFFGYSYHVPLIRSQAPKLNFGIAPMLQIDDGAPIHYANYWAETVSKKSAHQDIAWDFLQFVAKRDQVSSYLKNTHKPPALRSLYDNFKDDISVGVFTLQTLTAKNWYRGRNPEAAELFFGEMIDTVISGETSIKEAIRKARQKIQQTL